MGRSQKKRATRRHNPVRVPDSHLPKGLEAASATSSRKDEVLPIIRKLESVDPQERCWACSAVSNLIQNDPSTRRLLQGKNIVGALVTRLTDSVEEVVVEASGALRNLCIDAGYDICAEMYNKNILAPLQTFLPKISLALHHLVTSSKSGPENSSSELVYGLAENVITLLWCLSETSNKALNAINGIHLVAFLMGFLENRDKLPSRTVAAAAQCLYVLTDDNPPAIDELRSNSSYTACLLSIARGNYTPAPASIIDSESETKELAEDRVLSVKLLSAGILRNVQPIPAPSAASTVDIDRTVILPLVLPLLTSTSLSEASERVMELVKKREEEPKIEEKNKKPSLRGRGTPKKTDHSHRTPEERELERIEARLRNVLLALEVLTGVCATLPDPELDEELEFETGEGEGGGDVDEDVDIDDEEEDDGDDKMEDEDEDEVEMDYVLLPESQPELEVKANGTPHALAPPTLLPTILPPLLPLLQPTPLSFPPIDTGSAAPLLPTHSHPPTTSALGAIHVSALECLNNACLALSVAQAEAGVNAGVNAGGGGNGGEPVKRPRADVEDGRRLWDAIWSALAAVGLQVGRGQERRREMWEIAVGVLWGVGGIWKGSIVPDEEQVKLLMQFCDASSDTEVKVKCIGALESLAQYPDSIEANRVIAEYLLTLLTAPPSQSNSQSQSQTQPPEVTIQCASSLVDIYSDETLPYDTNFTQHGYLDRLASRGVENLRRAVRAVDRKKKEGGGGGGGRMLRARGEETLENLRDFLRYRRELGL